MSPPRKKLGILFYGALEIPSIMVFESPQHTDDDLDTLLPIQLKHRCKRLKRDLSAARSKVQRLDKKILKLTNANKALTTALESLKKQRGIEVRSSFFSPKKSLDEKIK